MLQAGKSPNLEAALVKDLGTNFEQEIPELVHAPDRRRAAPRRRAVSSRRRWAILVQVTRRSFSLRGGTREILRGIIARGLGLR